MILIAFTHGTGRKNDHFMAADRTCLMNLRPLDNDPLLCLIHDAEVHIFIRLLVRAQIAVALDIGHAGVSGKIIFLHVLEEIHETIVIMGPVLLIEVVADNRKGTEAVKACAPLVAGAHIAPQGPVDLHPSDEVLDRLGRKGKPVDALSCEGRHGGHQVLVLLVVRQFIGRTGCIYPLPNTGMVDGFSIFSPNM